MYLPSLWLLAISPCFYLLLFGCFFPRFVLYGILVPGDEILNREKQRQFDRKPKVTGKGFLTGHLASARSPALTATVTLHRDESRSQVEYSILVNSVLLVVANL